MAGYLLYMLALIHISRKSVGKKGILRRSPLLEYSVEKKVFYCTRGGGKLVETRRAYDL